MKPHITIRYCTQCNWMLRATWMAQELLHTFAEDLQGVTLEPTSGGIFEILVADKVLWERKKDGGFPSAKVLKSRLRDLAFPERELGHLDRP
ncbi:hypothetical protein Maes01_01320 [Microbulbifer aestuariivivens]|uniref:SelT/SelW/SelH family protein n=1 Tax=Microbulbifer aestuariivivens TaxID=1908308 RepID=A0ABP9WNH9_9GAMM